MPPLDSAASDRLRKLMGMTTSEHDGEALNALRMANAILAKAKLTWADMLGTVPRGRDVFTNTNPSKDSWTRSGFREYSREQAEEILRKAAGGNAKSRAYDDINDLAEELAKANRESAQEHQRRQERNEATEVSNARLKLETILGETGKPMSPAKRDYFEQIRGKHRESGYISSAHRAAIDRWYYQDGWDEPLKP